MTDDRFDRAIEEILADRSPRNLAQQLSGEEQDMLRVAAMLHGSSQAKPDPTFVAGLRHELRAPGNRISRRTAFLGGLGAVAAAAVAAFGWEHRGGASREAGGNWRAPITGKNGHWFVVSRVDAVPEGRVVAFTAGSVQGFLLHRKGKYHALSRICTHMGCALTTTGGKAPFVCPCHGAQFDSAGAVISGPGGYYGSRLPPLPRIEVRVNGENIEVLGV